MRSLSSLSELAPKNKILRALALALFLLMMGTAWLASSVSGALKNDPSFPQPETGHIVPLALRGVGLRYMTAQEWGAVSAYWNAYYLCGGLFVTLVVGIVLVNAYQGFMQGWRSDKAG